MNSLPYGSLSPTIRYSAIADATEQITKATAAITPASVYPYLPVYDDDDVDLITALIMDAQFAVEQFTGAHTTKRECVAEFWLPERDIRLPFGPHEITKVEQRSSVADDFTETTDYWTMGLNFKTIKLQYRRMTRVTFISGCEDVPEQMKTAITQEAAFKYKNRNDPETVAAESRGGLSVITRNTLERLDRSQFTVGVTNTSFPYTLPFILT